jgi:hypothetical protein
LDCGSAAGAGCAAGDGTRRRRPRCGRPARSRRCGPGRRRRQGVLRPETDLAGGGPRAPSPSPTPSVPPPPRLLPFHDSSALGRSWGWGMTEEESGVRRWLVDISSWRPSPAQFDAAAALLPRHERPAIARYRTSCCCPHVLSVLTSPSVSLLHVRLHR